MSYPPPPANGSNDPSDEPRYGARLPEGQQPQQPSSQQPPQYGAASDGFGSPVPPPANPYGGAQPGSEQQFGGPPPFQQQPYGGQPGLGGPSPYATGSNPTQRNALGITALVLGILSILLSCLTWPGTLVGIAAVVVGAFGLAAAKKGTASNRGLSLTGVILGAVAIVGSIIWIIVVFNSPEFAEMMQDFN